LDKHLTGRLHTVQEKMLRTVQEKIFRTVQEKMLVGLGVGWSNQNLPYSIRQNFHTKSDLKF
jgi:hypothetical protein